MPGVRLKIQRVAGLQRQQPAIDMCREAPLQQVDILFQPAAMDVDVAGPAARRQCHRHPVDAAARDDGGQCAARKARYPFVERRLQVPGNVNDRAVWSRGSIRKRDTERAGELPE
ncbi:hypothetical protein A4A58_21030 [Tardiphaga robiniae]|uniref:Uncharacterized protein n=1 Tax=Tardiphaga robiniae TaxID=943830 RepID=A0A161QTJ1_9BRAD|nr:hypothetical protein A4A58_21030 [Tardiphaga robiniae]